MIRSLGATVFLAACLAGCGGDDKSADPSAGGTSGSGGSAGASGGAGGAAGSSSGGAAGAGGSAGSAPGCTASSVAPGTSTRTISIGGIDREYVLHVPPSYDGTKSVPLVLNFHGLGSNMNQQEIWSVMDASADSAGFIVAYPNGLVNPTGGQQSWNAGVCCAFGDPTRDNLGFVNAVLDDIEASSCIDEKRVYATGMSNGGFMSHYLGCKLADRIAAIAPVAGVLGISDAECQPSRPISVIDFHGTGDTVVPYDGPPSVPDTFAGWAKRNGCTGTPSQTFSNGAAHCESYDTCNAGVTVTLCTLDGEGHCWPGQAFCPFGAASTDLSANDAMWALFQNQTLP